jgi:hypothetical protein
MPRSSESVAALAAALAKAQAAELATNWAQAALASKNSFTVADAQLIEGTFEQRLSELPPLAVNEPSAGGAVEAVALTIEEPPRTTIVDPGQGNGIDKSVLALATPRRYRNKAHLRYVAQQACLVCGRKPSDPHHLRHAQPRALGRKASDEFAVRQRQTRRSTRVRAPSARERTVAALTELAVPSSPKQVAAYAEARTGEPFDVRALASIRRDEYRSWGSGSKRDTYIVPALEGPWFLAGRGRLALSHWPLRQRIVGPLSPRADHLRTCFQIADRIESADTDPETCARMRALLAQYARSVPGALIVAWITGDELDVSRIRTAVAAELDLIQREDANSREREAERAQRQLTPEQLVWGGSMLPVVAQRSG